MRVTIGCSGALGSILPRVRPLGFAARVPVRGHPRSRQVYLDVRLISGNGLLAGTYGASATDTAGATQPVTLTSVGSQLNVRVPRRVLPATRSRCQSTSRSTRPSPT